MLGEDVCLLFRRLFVTVARWVKPGAGKLCRRCSKQQARARQTRRTQQWFLDLHVGNHWEQCSHVPQLWKQAAEWQRPRLRLWLEPSQSQFLISAPAQRQRPQGSLEVYRTDSGGWRLAVFITYSANRLDNRLLLGTKLVLWGATLWLKLR